MNAKSPSDVAGQPLLVVVVVLILLILCSAAAGQETVPTQGRMGYRVVQEGAEAPAGEGLLGLPLKKTRVVGDVSGLVARVTVQQFFSNPTPNRIEAVYTFPLPANAAVHESVMRIGDRVVRAQIQERGKARKTYEKAKKKGKKASLLEQERPNIFTQSVANIGPGEEIVVALQYVQELPYDDGAYSFTFPMTVGPRFVPGGPADAERITPPVLPPELRSGREVELSLRLRAGFPIREIASPSHEIEIAWEGTTTAVVNIAPGDRIPNKDFVLRYATVGREIETALLTHRDGEIGYFLLMVQPPARVKAAEAVPKEMVFVLDCSGSMSGIPMEVSKEVMRRFITGMNPDDTFQVIRFSESASALADRPLSNTLENQLAGLEYVEGLRGQGGTMMIEGIKAALDLPADPDRQRMVFFLTDGYIGNETQILAVVRERIGNTRIYSLGVGSSPNRYLIDELAREGRGFSQYVGNDEDPGPAVDRFFRRVNMPLLTSVEVDWNGLEVIDPMPRTVPDLFDRQPVFLVGRYREPGEATIFLRGRKGGAWTGVPVAVDLPERERENGALRLLWARRKIGDLMRFQHRGEVPEVRDEVLALALEHSLMSRYTSFVAVEHKIREDVALPLDTILIASELPEGMDYEAVFGEATLSLDRIKPGDPVLAVRAPAEAVAVLAEFPFGLRKRLVKDTETGLWVCRFLVPRHVAEGRHAIQVRIVLPHGDWVTTQAHFVVDATAPRFDLDWEIVGRALRFTARPLGGVFDETGDGIQALILPDVLSVLVRPPQGGYVSLEMTDTATGPVWEGTYDLPAWYRPGRYTFRFLSMDVARNTDSREVPVMIPAPGEKEL